MRTDGAVRRLIRPAVFAVLQRMPRLRWWVRRTYWRVQRRRFEHRYRNVRVDRRLVFLESYGGKSVSCSPKALYQAMLADGRCRDWRFVWSTRKDDAERIRTTLEHMDGRHRTRVVVRGSREYFDALAEAGVIVVNTRLPEYVWPCKEQTYVQCWHGTPLKRLGYDVAHTSNALNTAGELAWRFGVDARKWTFLLSPGAYTTRHLCDAFGVPERYRDGLVIEQGYPRNDALAVAGDAERRQARERLGVPEGARVLLYAPTWRDDQYQAGVGYVQGGLLDFDRLRELLDERWVVLFRAHYHVSNQLDVSRYRGFVIDVSREDDVNDLYIAADVLLTDYSSVMFDYAVTERPVVLYTPDRDRYEHEIRGFYMPFDEIPAPRCDTVDQVAYELNQIESWNARHGPAWHRFRQTYCPHDDGQASSRVLDRIVQRVETTATAGAR